MLVLLPRSGCSRYVDGGAARGMHVEQLGENGAAPLFLHVDFVA
jgi:hypothetical protein